LPHALSFEHPAGHECPFGALSTHTFPTQNGLVEVAWHWLSEVQLVRHAFAPHTYGSQFAVVADGHDPPLQ
jgi:hypothetical protein